MERTSIDDAIYDLRPGELRSWLRLHNMTQRQRITNFCKLGRRWEEDRKYVAGYLKALEDKGYIRIDRRSSRSFFVDVLRRLDASGPLFLKYSEK